MTFLMEGMRYKIIDTKSRSQGLVQIYRGYVDDPRNTDNAWMETVVINFHDEIGDKVKGHINIEP